MASDGERQPLLLSDEHTSKLNGESIDKDVTIIDFDPHDPQNPVEWTAAYRWAIVGLLAFMAFTVYVLEKVVYDLTDIVKHVHMHWRCTNS